MHLNHPETVPLPQFMEKLSSTKLVPGTKKVGARCRQCRSPGDKCHTVTYLLAFGDKCHTVTCLLAFGPQVAFFQAAGERKEDLFFL